MTVNFVPLNVRFPLSSNSPAVPARTTRPDVKSEIFADATVATPDTTKLSVSVVPVTSTPSMRVANFFALSKYNSTALSVFATIALSVPNLTKISPTPPDALSINE